MTQNLSRMFIESFRDENGDRMAFTLDQGKEGTKLFRETDGEESMVKPGGIGSMPISLTRDENGDYKLEAKWDMFLAGTGRGFEKQPFPGMDGSMLKAEAKMTFTIDAQAASEGRLEVRTNGDPVSVSFEGRMAGGPPVDV